MAKLMRKVALLGRHTYMISMPIKYVRANHISKGDEMWADIRGNEIVFSLDNIKYSNPYLELLTELKILIEQGASVKHFLNYKLGQFTLRDRKLLEVEKMLEIELAGIEE